MYKKRSEFKKIAAIAVGACGIAYGFGGAEVQAAPPEEGNWTLLPASSDEFDGDCLDENKWTNGIWYDVTTDLAFCPENVSVRDGNLVLTAKKQDYNGKAYTAGAVESKFDVPGTASYVEVRAKALDKKANVLSAIWMQSSPLSFELNPNPEIDIMETFDYTKMTSTIHTWNQSPSLHLQRGTNGWKTGLEDISADYHTYALERREGKMRFYFDGQLAWEKTSREDSFVELSRHMVLSLEGHLGTPEEQYLPGEFLVDYVRTYYDSDFAGLPESGTYQIVNQESKKVLDLSGDQKGIQLRQSSAESGSDSTKWTLTQNADQTWSIQNMADGTYVDLTADSGVTSNGNPVVAYPYHGGTNQRWYLVPTESGTWKLMSALSGKALCVENASLEEGAPIVQWSYEKNEDANDEWTFVPVQ